MNTCGTSFSVRFVKNGDYIRIVTNITKDNGSGTALFQVVDANSGVVAPDWTKTGEQPIISFSALSTVGYPVEITAISWGFHGQTLVFPELTSAWQNESNGLGFQARMNGQTPELRIVKNIASTEALSNRQITYEISYVSNGMRDKVQGNLDILIQASGESSYSMQITTPRILLDKDNPQTTLTVSAFYGVNPITIGKDGYSVEWYQGDQKLPGEMVTVPGSLTVTRDMVEGGSVFVAKLYKGGNPIAQDSQRINDIADTYQIQSIPVSPDYVSPKNSASFELSVLKNNQPLGPDVAVTYTWDIYNAIGVITKEKGTGSTVVVKPEYCKVAGNTDQNKDAYYSGVDVNVTASFN